VIGDWGGKEEYWMRGSVAGVLVDSGMKSDTGYLTGISPQLNPSVLDRLYGGLGGVDGQRICCLTKPLDGPFVSLLAARGVSVLLWRRKKRTRKMAVILRR
jgi:hypothetical protein